jgi:hypothetical protein
MTVHELSEAQREACRQSMGRMQRERFRLTGHNAIEGYYFFKNPNTMTQDSKEFFKAVAAVTTEQAMAEAVVGRELRQRWLTEEQRTELVTNGRDHSAEVIAVTSNSVFCKLYRTKSSGIDCYNWFNAKEFVNTFNGIGGIYTA